VAADENASVALWSAGLGAWSVAWALFLASFREALALPIKPHELGYTERKRALADQTEQHRLAGYVPATMANAHHHEE
jgi:hypothetical protein